MLYMYCHLIIINKKQLNLTLNHLLYHEHSTYDEVVERHSEIVPELYKSKCV